MVGFNNEILAEYEIVETLTAEDDACGPDAAFHELVNLALENVLQHFEANGHPEESIPTKRRTEGGDVARLCI